MKNTIQNLIHYLISQGIILENDKESVTLKTDKNGCLIVTYDPTGQILFNNCEDVNGSIGQNGESGVILNGSVGLSGFSSVGNIGLIGTTNIGQTGGRGVNGSDGIIGITGFSPPGPDGDQGTTNIGPVGVTTVGRAGPNSSTTLNFPTLHLNKSADSLYSTSVSPSVSNIFYDNIEGESISGMYNLTTNIFTVPYTGFYNISSTVFLELSNAGAVDTYARIKYFNNSTAVYIDNGASMYSVLRGTSYNIQLRHQNILHLTAGHLISFKVELFNAPSKTTDIIQKANSFTNELVRSCELYLYMISA